MMHNVPVRRISTGYRYVVHDNRGKDEHCVSEPRISEHCVSKKRGRRVQAPGNQAMVGARGGEPGHLYDLPGQDLPVCKHGGTLAATAGGCQGAGLVGQVTRSRTTAAWSSRGPTDTSAPVRGSYVRARPYDAGQRAPGHGVLADGPGHVLADLRGGALGLPGVEQRGGPVSLALAHVQHPAVVSRASPRPRWPGCPPRRRSFLRPRSDSRRSARRRSFAPIRSFELGVPESELSIASLRSSSASRSSSRRSRSRDASSSARNAATSASFASTTARSRDSSSRCPAITSARPGPSATSPKHAQPEPKVQIPASARASRKAQPREWTLITNW